MPERAKNSTAAENSPTDRLSHADRRTARRAPAASPLARRSPTVRVTAVVIPAEANAVPSTYTENTSW